MSKITFVDEFYSFACPWCSITIFVHNKDVRCKIFRCGILKRNNRPIPPHSNKITCNRLKTQKLIHGCGKPFQFDRKVVSKCGYI